MVDTTTSSGAIDWLVAHERRARQVSVGLAVGGALLVVIGSFVQVWFDVGWVPFDELGSLKYGDSASVPGLGDFWGMMLIGVVVVPLILGGAGLGEARKRGKARKKLVPWLADERRSEGTVLESSWSSEATTARMSVRDAAGVEYELHDKQPLGAWQSKAGTPVGIWIGERNELAIGTGGGIVSGDNRA